MGKNDQLTLLDIYTALYRTLFTDLWFVWVLYTLNIVARISCTFAIQFLFGAVEDNNIRMAYMWGAVASVLLFLDSMIRHNCFYEGPIISGKIKSCLIALIFKKILNLTQQTANLEQLGRVSNMLSNDFNMMEIKAPFFFGLCTFPIAYAAFLGVLIYRLGV